MSEDDLRAIALLTRAVTGHFIAIDIDGPGSEQARTARKVLYEQNQAVLEIICREVDARDARRAAGGAA